MLTEKQLEERTKYIGGSDAAIICGLSPYRNPVDLWQEKVGHIPAPDVSDKPGVKAGNFLEDGVLDWFESETGIMAHRYQETKFHKDYPFMAANVDGTGDGYIVEAKTTSSEKHWGETGTDEIPQHYRLQVAHYMAVYDVPKAYVAVLIRGIDFRYYVIHRNERLEKALIKREKEFWDCVQSKTPPEPKTASEIISLHGYESLEESAVADTEIEKCLERIDQVNFNIAVLEGEKQELADKIKVFMGKSDTLVDSSGKIAATWKASKPSLKFDAQAFKKANPEEHYKYVKSAQGSRRFLIKK